MTIDVLAWDPGAVTGWAAGDSSTGRIIVSGRVRETGGRRSAYRQQIREVFYSLVHGRGFDPKAGALVSEAPFVGRFPGSGLSLARRIGVIEGVCDTDLVEFPPDEWKTALGLTQCTPEDYKRFASTVPGVEPGREWTKPGDEASAICICVAVMNRVRAGLPLVRSAEEKDEDRKRRAKERAEAMPEGWVHTAGVWASDDGRFVVYESSGWWIGLDGKAAINLDSGARKKARHPAKLAQWIEGNLR